MIAIDFHIHTYRSPDCLMKPRKIIRHAKRRGLNGIVICDHETIQGALQVSQINDDASFLVVVGAEIRTDAGDIIGIFLKDEIRSRTFTEVVEEIRAQDGLVILPHPFKQHRLDRIDFDQIDFIEAYNARVDGRLNRKALELARGKNIPAVAGSDAHFYREIGRGRTAFASQSQWIPQHCEVRLSSSFWETASQCVKAVRTRDSRLLLGNLARVMKHVRSTLLQKSPDET